MNFSFNEKVKSKETISSKEQLIAQKFNDYFINKGKVDHLVFVDTVENINNIKDYILKLGQRLAPGIFSIDDVIKELKISGIIKPAQAVEKVIISPEVYEDKIEKLKGLTEVEITEEERETIEANLLYDEAHKRGIFKNDAELNEIYRIALSLEEKKAIESLEYYLEFADNGFIKSEGSLSPRQVVEHDFKALNDTIKKIEENGPQDLKLKEKLLNAKKIATVVERALSYICTNGEWYGGKIKIVLTSLFDDVKRGVDEVCIIEKDNENHDTLGLAIDSTFRGIKSEQFKEKFYKILVSIKEGHKTKIKYFKDHNGKMMKEFAIPKIILHFDINDVKEFVDIIKGVGGVKEKENLNKNYLKQKVMSQLIGSCNLLASFAEKHKNSIFRDYHNVVNSIKELSWENEEIKDMINVDDNDEFIKQLKFLLKEFEELEKYDKYVSLNE